MSDERNAGDADRTDQDRKDLARPTLRERLHAIVFEAECPAGKAFDIVLLVLIVASVTAISLESVESFAAEWGEALLAVEWGFTIVFTIEYAVRLYCVKQPLRYATSFFGVIDLLALLPQYLMLLFGGAHQLGTVRILRLIRVFRVLKLVRFLGEARVLHVAMRASLPKITVFLLGVWCAVVVIGSVMHLVEGKASGFDSIPRSVYWAIVTLTTVGYGDISPRTGLGQAIASMVMLMGYAVIAVPTGIVSAELVRGRRDATTTRVCENCAAEDHRDEAVHCYRCGEEL
ncbi:MAG: ion transporter [bacterium]|nr:ion transporter [bacterium]